MILFEIEKAILFFLNQFLGQKIWLDNLFIFSADGLIFLIFAFVLFKIIKEKEKTIFLRQILPGLILVLFFYYLLSQICPRPRPFMVIPTIYFKQTVFSFLNESSFPSLHTAISFFFAFFCLTKWQNFGMLILAMAILSSVSRVAIGFHWFSDVVGGTCLGYIATAILKNYRNKM